MNRQHISFGTFQTQAGLGSRRVPGCHSTPISAFHQFRLGFSSHSGCLFFISSVALVQEDRAHVKHFVQKNRRIKTIILSLPISPVCTCSCWINSKVVPLKNKTSTFSQHCCTWEDTQRTVGTTADGESLADGIPGMPPWQALF